MKTLRFWFRPAILVLFWAVLTASSLAELATLTPLLRADTAPRYSRAFNAPGRPLNDLRSSSQRVAARRGRSIHED
jgi:hypothetical protein